MIAMDITKEKPNRTLLVLKYLWDNSDIDHPATIKDIAAYLEGFGYNATRKTISKDIDELIEIGIDIDCKREEHNLYFLDVRVFELAEVKLLVDAVGIVKRPKTPGCGSGIRGFESHYPPHKSIFFAGVSPSGKATDSDSVMRRFESFYPRQFF